MNNGFINQVRNLVHTAKHNSTCSGCGKSVVNELSSFTDEISFREYQISALCQSCQDDVFAEDEDEE